MRNPFSNHAFLGFVCKKAVFYLIVAFVAMTFVFLIPRLMPGNPIDAMIHNSRITMPEVNYTRVKVALMKYWGFDQPLLGQYVNFWVQLAYGNLGPSFAYFPKPVASIVLWTLPFTLALVVPVLFISFFLGNWIGAKAAYVGGKWSEFVYFFSVFANTMPVYWFGMVLIFLLAAKAQLFPTGGYCDITVIPSWSLIFFLNLLEYYFLPFLTLFFIYFGGWAIGMRSMVIYEKGSDYVRYGEQLGFRKNKLLGYAKRNAILPQFTGFNLYFEALIGETMVIETIFGWPGIGRLMYNAVMKVDYPLIFGCFLITMVVVIFGNFLIDVVYGFIDPRIRTGYGR